MKILCAFSKYQYGRPELGVGIEYAAFYRALQDLGHEVIHFETWDRTEHADFAALNRALVTLVDEERPDVMFAIQVHYEIWTETLDLISARGVATVNWTTDDSWKYDQFSRFLAGHFKLITTTYDSALKKYRQDGHHNAMITQWAASGPNLRPPKPGRECKYQVSFVGAADAPRVERVKELEALDIHVECFGKGWPNGPVAAEDIALIMQDSVISLNFSNSTGINQIKARLFEVPGAGGFLLTDLAPGLERWYVPGREIETYKSMSDCAGQARRYLANLGARDAIAIAGHARTAAEHTYDARLNLILKAAVEGIAPAPLAEQAKCADLFQEAIESHRLTAPMRVFRTLSIRLCSLLWGADRGPRAARRIVFEVSWRMFRARTYSARGLPGRLYYAES